MNNQAAATPVWLITVLAALSALATLTILLAVALERWPAVKDGVRTPMVSQVGPDGTAQVVVHLDDNAQYSAPGTINGIEVEFVIDTGATHIAIPMAIAGHLKLRQGPKMKMTTASEVVPAHMVILDAVSLGPLTRKRVPGSVSKKFIGERVLLGMSFLQHFDLSQRGRSLTLRDPAQQ